MSVTHLLMLNEVLHARASERANALLKRRRRGKRVDTFFLLRAFDDACVRLMEREGGRDPVLLA